MKTSHIVLIVAGLLVLILGWTGCGKYNTIVTKQEATKKAWAQVENVYQRRMDLIPNLVNTVKGAADFEKNTLTQVVEARAKATQMTVDASKLSPDQIKAFQSSQGELSQALGRLMVVAEQYPQLRATEAFRDLTVQLEGTENRITVERKKFNDIVGDYNTYIKRFPNNLFAGLMGAEEKGYFEMTEGADVAPEVQFEF
jgi:LemA protein